MGALVFVRFVSKAGNEAKIEQILRGMVANTRQESGNQRYDLFKSTVAEGRTEFNLIEQYVDDAAVQFHRDTPHYKDYRAHIIPLLEAPPSVTMLQPIDVRNG